MTNKLSRHTELDSVSIYLRKKGTQIVPSLEGCRGGFL